jgi:hypothetical protein
MATLLTSAELAAVMKRLSWKAVVCRRMMESLKLKKMEICRSWGVWATTFQAFSCQEGRCSVGVDKAWSAKM